MVQITNVYQRAITLLVSQFRDTDGTISRNNFEKLFYALSTVFQEIQDTLWDLKTQRSLETAVGVQLDGLGEIVGLERKSGQSDEDYRRHLIFQSYINSSQGTPEELLNALKFFSSASKVWYFDMFPAGYILATDGAIAEPKTDVIEGLDRMAPCGVASVPVIMTFGYKPLELVSIDYEVFGVQPDTQEVHPLDVNSDNLYVNAFKTTKPIYGSSLAYFDSNGDLVTQDKAQISGIVQLS